MIAFYPNKMSNAAPIGTWTTSSRMTIEAWLKSMAPSYDRRESPPISVVLNDEVICHRAWHKVKFKPSDQVEIYFEPKGTDPFTLTYALFKGAKAVIKWMQPKMPGMPTVNTTSGDPINEASAKGNKVKLGDRIREVAGWQRVYPSYLTEPRRYFVSPREQWVEMFLYISKGEVDVPLSRMKVGDTPLISLGADAQVAVYGPGESVLGDPASMLWYNVTEVGASSSGNAGLELTVATTIARSATASAYQFNGESVSVPAGAGQLPADWESGLVIRVLPYYQYTVIDGGTDRDIVQGPLGMLNPYVGMPIEVQGVNAGDYVVHSYTPFSPAVPANPGTASTLTGSAAPTRYDFNVTPLSFTLARGSSTYPITLNTATTDLAGLVSALNTKLSGSPLQAQQSSGRVRFVEVTPFAGQAVTATGAATILGPAPVGVTGTATTSGTPEQPAQMTLNFDGGAPVNSLAAGSGMAAIGPRGMRYRITSYNTALMTLERLTASGSVDDDWPGFDLLNTVNAVITLDASNLEGGYRGPYACQPEGQKVTAIEYSVFYANGLFGLGREGQIYQTQSFHTFEYRDMDIAGEWTVVEGGHVGDTRDALGFTHRVNLPYPMRAEARIKKRWVALPGRANDEANDDSSWYSLYGLRQTRPATYPGMTTMAVRIRGGDRISAQSESDISVEATRVLPVRSAGAWQAAMATRGIAPWCLSRLKAVGYKDSDIDLEEFDRLDAIWNAAGQFYDETIDESMTLKDALNNALACGWAELVVVNSKIRPVQDVPRAAFDREYGLKTQTYSPQNMTKALAIQGPLASINDYDGVDVEYYSTKTWAWETVPCRWPGDEGIKVEIVRLPGCGDRDRAYRFGMRRRGHQKFRLDTYEWSTELSGRNSGYLSFCAVASDSPGRCQSALLVDFVRDDLGVVLESSEPLDWSAGGDHRIGVRRQDGTLSGPYPATQIDDVRVRIAELDFEPDVSWDLEPPHLLFGPWSRWAYPVLVTSSDPSGGNVAMKGMPYDERVYTYDNAMAPE
ncbi:hypothetical protein JGK41_000777 [Pseudomonas putida]|nr:hypothetical protein [Pseudomonas putida]